MLQRLLLLLAAAAMIFVGAWWLYTGGRAPQRAESPQPVAVIPVTPPLPSPVRPAPGPAPAWIAAPGVVEPRSGVIRLGFATEGVIGSVDVEEGDTVQQGQILARLAGPESQAGIAAGGQALAASEARLDDLSPSAGKKERQDAKDAVDAARAALAAAQVRAEKAMLRSPLHGIVLRKFRRPGEVVSPSRDTPVLTVGDTSKLRVRAAVPERDIARLAVGQHAVLIPEAFAKHRFTGIVSRLAPALRGPRDFRVLEVVIDLDGTPRLPVGLAVQVYIVVRPGGEKELEQGMPTGERGKQKRGSAPGPRRGT
ncbi:biotin/lipoyl attachment domain-containing protein [Solidesulfovibrio fructosivorans JJ]]|uniref:Biotin/lipoyl attachment domain-containing protein n=1 Tax=Solidesulfovibrio fructosivorans JJ] TaxID=596151 RepID=E1JXK8_SOLFR|nr:efflux RND transporter periplasmic adaptor subunit [Solidesulfovibrio fructosivorans]EFL50985.1 biotin/lipoyl attachment domain-containing protein [Solidesulfovibrio fructosivorans JJ]]